MIPETRRSGSRTSSGSGTAGGTPRARSRLHAALRLPWTRRSRPSALETVAATATAVRGGDGGGGNEGGSGDAVGVAAGAAAALHVPARRAIPSSPPPSYEHVLAENRLAAERALAAATAAAAADAKGAMGAAKVSMEAAPYSERSMMAAAASEKAAEAAGASADRAADADGAFRVEEASACVPAAAAATVAPKPVSTGPTEILHKSSKELYRAVAAQWGIACKMSDHCRCLDCQSRYFDCEFDQNEQEKTDGGLGAGTPMFISEVMHGSACVIL